MKKINLLLFALVLFLASNAYAGSSSIIRANNMVGVGYLYTSQYYAEHMNNIPSDSESGHAGGVKLFASVMRNLGPISNMYGYADYYRGAGAGNYTYPGFTGFSSGFVLNGYSLRGGKGFEIANDVMATPYINYGYREWSRNIGYQELFEYNDMGIGVLGEYTPINRFVLKGRIQMDEMLSDELHVYNLNGANDIPITLGKKPVYTFSVGANYLLVHDISIFGNLSYMRTSFGQSSNGAGPNSDTADLNLNIGIGYNF